MCQDTVMMPQPAKGYLPSDVDARFRSILQKAVRRGKVDLVITISALLKNQGIKALDWFKTLATIITFEECWPLGSVLVYNSRFHSGVAALVRVTESTKTRDAAGLGYLAHALSKGDRSVLTSASHDQHTKIKIVADGIRRPGEYWKWIESQARSGNQKALVKNAARYSSEGLPRDQAVVKAAAYLCLNQEWPTLERSEPNEQGFPYWLAFDAHTRQGRRTYKDIARDLHISLTQLEWVSFYFEGSVTDSEIPSPWWDLHCRWRFQKIGLPSDEAHLVWEPIKSQVYQALELESRKLQKDIYLWKLAHREQVEILRKQVNLFLTHQAEVQRDQKKLF